jgi:peroxiredoxin
LSGNQVGDTAIDFRLTDQNGIARTLSNYIANVILLDISATWCPPCQSEASVAESLYQEYKDAGFTIITVLQDSDIAVSDCATWATTYGLTFPVLADINQEVWNSYNEDNYIPLNIVIDKDFVIRYKQYGYYESEIRSVIELYL